MQRVINGFQEFISFIGTTLLIAIPFSVAGFGFCWIYAQDPGIRSFMFGNSYFLKIFYSGIIMSLTAGVMITGLCAATSDKPTTYKDQWNEIAPKTWDFLKFLVTEFPKDALQTIISRFKTR
jgi:hypothetical protein